LERLGSRLGPLHQAIDVRPDQGDAPGQRSFAIAPGPASADVIAELAAWAVREGLLLVEVRAGGATLEERYLELTGDHDVEVAA